MWSIYKNISLHTENRATSLTCCSYYHGSGTAMVKLVTGIHQNLWQFILRKKFQKRIYLRHKLQKPQTDFLVLVLSFPQNCCRINAQATISTGPIRPNFELDQLVAQRLAYEWVQEEGCADAARVQFKESWAPKGPLAGRGDPIKKKPGSRPFSITSYLCKI